MFIEQPPPESVENITGKGLVPLIEFYINYLRTSPTSASQLEFWVEI